MVLKLSFSKRQITYEDFCFSKVKEIILSSMYTRIIIWDPYPVLGHAESRVSLRQCIVLEVRAKQRMCPGFLH